MNNILDKLGNVYLMMSTPKQQGSEKKFVVCLGWGGKRNRIILEPFIKNYVNAGSMINTDYWREYRSLASYVDANCQSSMFGGWEKFLKLCQDKNVPCLLKKRPEQLALAYFEPICSKNLLHHTCKACTMGS